MYPRCYGPSCKAAVQLWLSWHLSNIHHITRSYPPSKPMLPPRVHGHPSFPHDQSFWLPNSLPHREMLTVGYRSTNSYYYHAWPTCSTPLEGVSQLAHLCTSSTVPLNLDNHIKAQVERVLRKIDETRQVAHKDDLDLPFTPEVLDALVLLLLNSR